MSKPFRVRWSPAAIRDVELIFDYLVENYRAFGDEPAEAFDRAVARAEAIKAEMRALGATPFQGTLRNDLMPGLRYVTKNWAIYYFVADPDEQTVDIVAVFFGGQDHQRHMLTRILSRE